MIKGYRGYISTRCIRGQRIPQHVQNLVVREYARRNGLEFKLSATEHASEACYLILEEVMADLSNLEGIIAYSMYMLPTGRKRRRNVYKKIIDSGCKLHMAVENFEISKESHIERIENIWNIQGIMDVQSHQISDYLTVFENEKIEIAN